MKKRLCLELILIAALGTTSLVQHRSKIINLFTEHPLTTTIVENAANNQVVFLGESSHVSDLENDYTLKLLPKLKEIGFEYFGVEIDTHEQPLIDRYLNGEISRKTLYKELDEISEYVAAKTKNLKGGVSCGNRYRSKPFVPLMKKAHDLGFKVYCYDERPINLTAPGDPNPSQWGTDRNIKEFENLKKLIFDKDPKAKVVLYGGSWHRYTKPRGHPEHTGKKETPLGYFLEQYTKGKYYPTRLGANCRRY